MNFSVWCYWLFKDRNNTDFHTPYFSKFCLWEGTTLLRQFVVYGEVTVMVCFKQITFRFLRRTKKNHARNRRVSAWHLDFERSFNKF
jgi:hypothetical protein